MARAAWSAGHANDRDFLGILPHQSVSSLFSGMWMMQLATGKETPPALPAHGGACRPLVLHAGAPRPPAGRIELLNEKCEYVGRCSPTRCLRPPTETSTSSSIVSAMAYRERVVDARVTDQDDFFRHERPPLCCCLRAYAPLRRF